MHKNKVCTVYSLSSSENGVIRYVGQTLQPLHCRLSGHVARAKRGARGPLHQWIRKVLEEGQEVVIKALESPAVWNVSEIEWIAKLRADGVSLVNKTDGGWAQAGYKLPPETKEHLRGVVADMWRNPEYRERVLSGHARFWTPERREAQAERAKRQPRTDEAREKVSKSLRTGRYADPVKRQEQKQRLDAIRSDAALEEKRRSALRKSLTTDEYRERQRQHVTEIWRLRRAGLLPMPKRKPKE